MNTFDNTSIIDNNEQIFSIKKIKAQKKWTKEEDDLLIFLAENYKEKHWKEISKSFTKKNSLQCFSRYKRIRPGIVKGSWTKEEDSRIVELVNKYGKTWSKIAKTLGTRNGKQIRDRFLNVLDPSIKKGKFSDDEDSLLISLYHEYGSRWATIAKFFPSRTADMIKNRFHSSIKKKLFPENFLKKDLTSDELKDEFSAIGKFETEDSIRSMGNCSSLSNNGTNSHIGYEDIAQNTYTDFQNYNNFTSNYSEKDFETNMMIDTTFNNEFLDYPNKLEQEPVKDFFNFDDFFTI